MASGSKKKWRKLWKDEDMVAALESVYMKTLTAAQGVTMYNVPRKMLDDQVKGRVVHGTNPGRDTIFSPTEEKALSNYLVNMAERGFPLMCSMVMAFAWAIALRSGKGSHFNPELGPGEH